MFRSQLLLHLEACGTSRDALFGRRDRSKPRSFADGRETAGGAERGKVIDVNASYCRQLIEVE